MTNDGSTDLLSRKVEWAVTEIEKILAQEVAESKDGEELAFLEAQVPRIARRIAYHLYSLDDQ